jgi:hypothetical protein
MRRLLLLIVSSLLPLASYGDEASWLTRSGYYHVSYQSELRPIVINRIHTWIFHIETPDGAPVDEAEISVTGGMPLHNHGLPTAPQMTTSLGNGNYRVEGMRFHMNGDWELLVTVDVAGRRDTVIIPLTL